MSDEVRGIVVAHSSLAAGLVSAARQISGMPEDALVALSNDCRGPESLAESLREILGDGPGIVFTDLPSGSCAFAARRITLDRADTAILSGVNLPVLLDFAFHRDLPLPELVERLLEKGKAGLTASCREAAAHADRALSG
ncbi:MAG: system fructose subfamily component [Gemmatimonadetes bacterium]|nr:system fructose subfamily component [Gemmatimonadota bacterium]